jgi:hypothetical protein
MDRLFARRYRHCNYKCEASDIVRRLNFYRIEKARGQSTEVII